MITADTRVTVTHRAVEDECWAAYLDGFAAGLHEANVRMSEALDAAFAGPSSCALTEPGTERGPGGYTDVLRRFKKSLYLREVRP